MALKSNNKNRMNTSHLFLTALLSLIFSQAALASTLNEVREKGFLDCGIHSSLPGFSIQSESGWQGMEVDLCRAVAAAVLQNAQSVRFTPIASEQGYGALQSGDIDILVRHNRWTLLPDTALGLTFVTPWFYRENGYLANQDADIILVSDLENKKVCTYPETEKDAKALGIAFEAIVFPSFGIAIKAFENGQCDAIGGETTQLSIARQLLPETLKTQVIPTEEFPVATGPLIRQGDHEWFKIVRWTIFLLQNAEKLNFTQDEAKKPPQKYITTKMVVNAGASGLSLGLGENWPVAVIEQLGNYAEIYQRNLGKHQIPRGVNNLNDRGGLHNPPTIE